jgi:hypothetical protein
MLHLPHTHRHTPASRPCNRSTMDRIEWWCIADWISLTKGLASFPPWCWIDRSIASIINSASACVPPEGLSPAEQQQQQQGPQKFRSRHTPPPKTNTQAIPPCQTRVTTPFIHTYSALSLPWGLRIVSQIAPQITRVQGGAASKSVRDGATHSFALLPITPPSTTGDRTGHAGTWHRPRALPPPSLPAPTPALRCLALPLLLAAFICSCAHT